MTKEGVGCYCTVCGAGIVSSDNKGVVVRLQRGYPFSPPCEECERRDKQRLFDLGRLLAQQLEDRVFDLVMNGETEGTL